MYALNEGDGMTMRNGCLGCALGLVLLLGACNMGSSIANGTAKPPRTDSSGGQTQGSVAASASGGTTGSGGTSATDGTSATGGSSATGGTTVPAGGGGTGGDSATGGNSATGGRSATGGAVPAAGGSVPNGGDAGVGPGSGGATGYHKLAKWMSPAANNPNQHGRYFFISNGQKDDKGVACTACHGANLDGGSGPSCASCHSTWRSCTYCHGTSPSQINPPRGVFDESTTGTLAIGRHVAHLSSGASHTAFDCAACHVVPAAGDVSHTLPYRPSSDLSTEGNHGEVTFSGLAMIWNGTTWNVTATSGTPVSARGTCTGACHSDGRGGAPAKTPYWAGGTWTTGCGNCHAASPSTGHHSHALSNGATCADCHDGATTTSYASANHMNGTRDFKATVQGQSMTLKASGTTIRCSGTCHGNSDGHSSTW